MFLIPSPHMLVLVINERFLPARGIFRAILASESHWLQPVLVLSVHWWPTPIGVGRVLVFIKPIQAQNHVFEVLYCMNLWAGPWGPTRSKFSHKPCSNIRFIREVWQSTVFAAIYTAERSP